MFTNVQMKARIESVISYYEKLEDLHVLQLQLRYDKASRPCRPYQVFTFKFSKNCELQRCIFEFKAAFGVKDFNELKNKEADVSFCLGRDEKFISGAELNVISLEENGKRWYPMAIGISDGLETCPTIFS